MIRELRFTVLPDAQAWSSELCRITSGSLQKPDQDLQLANDAKTSDKTQIANKNTKLKLKRDLITFAQNWKKQQVSYSFGFINYSLKYV